MNAREAFLFGKTSTSIPDWSFFILINRNVNSLPTVAPAHQQMFENLAKKLEEETFDSLA